MAKLIQCNIPSINLRKCRAFYATLFGDQPFARSLSDDIEAYHQPISVDGIQLTISPRQMDTESVTCYFAVDDLDATLTELEKNGGTVLREAFDLTIAPASYQEYQNQVKQNHPPASGTFQNTVGRSAIVQDPDGNIIGLTQLTEQAYWLYKYGPYATRLAPDQVAQHERGIALAKTLSPIKD